jgi:hypothetical protein
LWLIITGRVFLFPDIALTRLLPRPQRRTHCDDGRPEAQVSLLKPEEAEQYMHIRHETFRNTFNKILYSRGEASQKTLNRVTSNIQDGSINKDILFIKCVDTMTGEMIAMARWVYVKPKDEGATERTCDEVDADLRVPDPFDESNPGTTPRYLKHM